ncbi:ABC transporter ATP-binding protein [Sulfurisphaera ohwakuensis]|uniref:ABC-2 type transport system ATP-binding protein n=1 Tax=Sulfurisphaera ohwakuensis TaxID=69656 RepID=A0A650CHL6_SULOH|nr:ABC transporter ATP-binding protein [Sulfurisphaera ohwakuensis]MBB5254797.1 ABC-2 type transport system ATP-binding protein [Sulfurisphaera ohwakuensis]QGR17290.1 ATP-binding cassette domain-containing protein [Sulfurisphaera ohwakuensis]
MNCIELRNVVKKYGKVTALNNVSFTIECGEKVALLGPNGAGKSTTLKLIVGLLRPDNGEVLVKGLDPFSTKARGIIGYLPEDASPYLMLTVRENLEYIASLRGVNNVKDKVDKLLDFLALRQYEKNRVMSLSRGNRQKLALALALIHDPEILLLDEPLNYLDIPTQERVISLLNSMTNATMLVSTHIMSIARRLASKVIILSNGQVVWQGNISDLKKFGEENEPIESIVARLMESVK